jgi:hypothetical protein
MIGQCAFERDVAAGNEALPESERVDRIAALLFSQHIGAALHADERPVPQSAIDEAIAARIAPAQQFRELPFVEDAPGKPCGGHLLGQG